MIVDYLYPSMDLLSQEYVLIQAWKKTASYIRYHNWYSDTLALDMAAVDLPRFLAEVAEHIKSPDQWANDPLRIVPAPKSQPWHIDPDANGSRWVPDDENRVAEKLRPLAHVSLKDQVIATAVMLCLADRVETRQGDPRKDIRNQDFRAQVVSYGNRLYCHDVSDILHHTWGSGKLYRAYYQDYRRFLSRPDIVADELKAVDLDTNGNTQIVFVHSDLRQFYDRVKPPMLAQKIDALKITGDDELFFDFTHRLLNWNWDTKDQSEVTSHAKQAGLSDFSTVALPQGLVAAGFFANVTLLDFDQSLRDALHSEISSGIVLEDACRYVDDLRFVLTVDGERSLNDIEQSMISWLRDLLSVHSTGLMPSEDKTIAARVGGDERPLVLQSRKIDRIQHAISGGFDVVGGDAIIDSIQGLIRSQRLYSDDRSKFTGLPFVPVADVRDATVARFAAGRFRSTYRSLRPLLLGRDVGDDTSSGSMDIYENLPRTQAELDDEARAYALYLIDCWIKDPSNVRLLRIGLDLWPDVDVITRVLLLLRPYTKVGKGQTAACRVAYYCLAEIFRAGATETGVVADNESLPKDINIDAYRSVLIDEAITIMSLPTDSLPWYLQQQILLFVASNNKRLVPIDTTSASLETELYIQVIMFMRGMFHDQDAVKFAIYAILSRRSFLDKDTAVTLATTAITTPRLEEIAKRDVSFALEILDLKPVLRDDVSIQKHVDLCTPSRLKDKDWVILTDVVLSPTTSDSINNDMRNELAILRFAAKFLEMKRASGAVSPCDVMIKLAKSNDSTTVVDDLKMIRRSLASNSIYQPPSWCANNERWRFQLGYLMRFILTKRIDITQGGYSSGWRGNTDSYRSPGSHWLQRKYGMYSGHSAYGDDWLPITEWTEKLISALIAWPGCNMSPEVVMVKSGIDNTRKYINAHLSIIEQEVGSQSKVLMLPMSAPIPIASTTKRMLRACIVQTVLPNITDIKQCQNDLTFSDKKLRVHHRNHLSAALAAVKRMLDLRETHKEHDGRIDWLILPELSVHPDDVKTHLVPFARAHKAIILAGLTYQELFAGQPLVNSAIWVIPTLSPEHGLQIVIRRQGKYHLAQAEDGLNTVSKMLMGFRPCQWIVNYEWINRRSGECMCDTSDIRPLKLTASICYDATDLGIVSDLRNRSDVYAIPAYNKDVQTYDNLGESLHYHMFQMVVVVNNGVYGGSNAHAPYKEHFRKKVFHLHGQPQASIAFLEIEDIRQFISRVKDAKTSGNIKWKYPPAGIE